ncbi:NirD/YgiW/YdeI family stress tolerance protein [Stenotrophomonas sp. NPDC077659]|uniref:NirD/YgiW/YdeI family stress tolerance protein n=1 Tax=Stenotrophomonas sp. NPDC077659 TaxID=3390694 RepID=UPI003D010469
MKHLFALALVATPLGLISADAFAQYTGPDAGAATTTVAEARTQRDDHAVVLRGTLVARIGDERYQFRDVTGQIEVEIDDEDLPRRPFGADTVVELRGKVDTHHFKPTDIDVDQVTVVPAG